jgi:hypothetical protein
MTKFILAIGLCILFLTSANAQKTGMLGALCGKTWYPEKYKETDGKIYPLEAEYRAQYIRFDCDGNYESLEDDGVVLKGKWKLDAQSKNILSTQTVNKKFPSNVTTSLVSCSEKDLSIKKRDGGGQWITIYLKAK